MHTTADPEAEFERELATFGRDADIAIHCFYVWLTIHAEARKSRRLFHLLGRNSFWMLASGSIQENSLMALSRIFDKDKRSHSLASLLGLGQKNIEIFSKDALRKRKFKQSANAHEWIDDYMRGIYVPKDSDFERWQLFAEARRKVYESCYKQLRDKVYAHSDRIGVADIVGKTSTRELGRLVSDLYQLFDELRDLLQNGRKPRLRPLRHAEGHRIERDTRKFLKSLLAGKA